MPSYPNIPNVRETDPLSAEQENVIRAAVREHIFGLGNGKEYSYERTIIAILTARSSDVAGFFEWQEAEWTGTAWVEVTDGKIHTDYGLAFEQSGLKAVPLGAGFPVLLRKSLVTRGGTAGDEDRVWEFAAPRKWIWAKLTGHALLDGSKSRYKYAWTEVVRNADAWEAPSWTALSGTTSEGYAVNSAEAYATTFAANGGEPVRPADSSSPVVHLYETLSDAGARSYSFCWSGDAMVVVKVTKDGGVAGSATANCSMTYTVKDWANNTLGTAKTPKRPRFANCEYDVPAADSPGLAYWDDSGVLQLYEAVEEKPKGDVVTLVTNVSWDGSALNKYTKDILVLEASTETGPTEIVDSDDCA